VRILERITELLDVGHLDERLTGRPAPRIYDTTLRDGEQAPGIAFTPRHKLAIAVALAHAGVHIIDVGFPAANESDAEALGLILDARARGDIPPTVEILVMCRALPRDIDVTATAARAAGFDLDAITLLLFTSASSLHVKYKLGESLLAEAGRARTELEQTPVAWFHAANADRLARAIDYARARGAGRIEFGAEDASRTPLSTLIPLVARAVHHGADRYIFADTTGVLTPARTATYCQGLRDAFPTLPLVAHFHNDFDLATVNTITAYRHGMDLLSVTVNGIGERAGNAPLHAVVAGLRSLHGVEIPGFHYESLSSLSALVGDLSGVAVSPSEPIVGANAFTHESGIHVQGVLVTPAMYEVMTPESVGSRRQIAFGKHSGIAGVRHVLASHREQLGLGPREIDKELVVAIVEEVKARREAAGEASQRAPGFTARAMTEQDVLSIAQTIIETRSGAPPLPDVV
jgi:isopropylmalate/homocitrate/citramalate synthase